MKKIIVDFSFMSNSILEHLLQNKFRKMYRISLIKRFPETNFRFDGVIVLPDNTMYLPIFPAKVENVDEVGIKQPTRLMKH